MDEKKKYSKYAIASFGLAVFSFVLLWSVFWMFQILIIVTLPISIIYGVFSLYSIKKQNLRGKVFAMLGLIISVIIILGYIVNKYKVI